MAWTLYGNFITLTNRVDTRRYCNSLEPFASITILLIYIFSKPVWTGLPNGALADIREHDVELWVPQQQCTSRLTQ